MANARYSACAEDMADAQRLRLLAGALAHVDLWPGEAVPGRSGPFPGHGLCYGWVGRSSPGQPPRLRPGPSIPARGTKTSPPTAIHLVSHSSGYPSGQTGNDAP